jgi:hypothetical protein
MVVPNFVPMIKLTTITNWFELKTRHPEQRIEATDMIRLSRKYQTASNAMQRLCDSGRYRPVDLELLGDRLSQLESLLPMQSHQVQLPYEADLSGSEIFSSTNAGLSPRLLTWYGEDARAGGSIFILGSGFNVRDMKVIVGGATVKDAATAAAPAPGAPPSPSFDLISRNVLRVDIPSDAKPVRTPVIFRDPSFVCDHGGQGLKDDGTCDDCAKLKGERKDGDIAVKTADRDSKRAAQRKAEQELSAAQKNLDDLKKATPKPKAEDIAQADKAVNDKKAALDSAKLATKSAEAALKKAQAPSSAVECQCKQRYVLDVHVATSNGISNHLHVEVAAPDAKAQAAQKPISSTVTTTYKVNPDNSTTTTTQFQTVPPGIVLPQGTFLPMGGNLPAAGTVVAPGAATIQTNPPAFSPGTVPNTQYPPATPTDPTGPSSSIDPGPVDPVAIAPGTAAPENSEGAISLRNTPGAGNAPEVPSATSGAVPPGFRPADATRKAALVNGPSGGRVGRPGPQPGLIAPTGVRVAKNSQPALFLPAPVFPAWGVQTTPTAPSSAGIHSPAASSGSPALQAAQRALPSTGKAVHRSDPGVAQASMAGADGTQPVDALPKTARRKTILSRILGGPK